MENTSIQPTNIPIPKSHPEGPLRPIVPSAESTPSPSPSPKSFDSLPSLITISNSDNSDSDLFSHYGKDWNMSSQYANTTLLPRSSSAVYIGKQGKLPVITPGKLMPDLLFDFENGAYSYFSFKEVKLEEEVSKVTSGLQDGRVQTWCRLNRAAVDTAGFTQFIKSVHANWLEPGW